MKRELELYIHIPFCVRKCGYCDFLSGPADDDAIAVYTEVLKEEAAHYGELRKECEVSSIFFGGGTPSMLRGEQLESIMIVLRKTFGIQSDAEVTMEMNPGTVSEEKALIYRRAGVNRVSLGLQSADNEELRMLGRIHTYEEFLETYAMLRRTGYDNINVDLISGIPGQTSERFKESLRKVLHISPEHISAYSLIVEEGTAFYGIYGEGRNGGGGYPPLPDEEEERRIYHHTKDILWEAGYERYEISNYAKPGYACRHNLGYWERKEYIGLGIGAASLYERRRFSNTESMEEYICAKGCPEKIRRSEETLSEQACMEEFMFLGLRKIDGVSEAVFQKTFGSKMDAVYKDVLGSLEQKELLVRRDGNIRLTEKGIDISNSVMAEFLI